MDSSLAPKVLNKIRSLPLDFRYIWQLDFGIKCKGGLTHFLGAGIFA